MFSPRAGWGLVRGFGRFAALSKNHYDALGVTPKATQADVKAAYYKLSKMYHPDTNKDSVDAVEKFRDVTEAYEVLGNVKLRRLYDKGVPNLRDGPSMSHHGFEAEEEHPTTKFYRSREFRSRPPPPTGRTPIYDFDEWAKSHYGASFARDQQSKRRQAARTYSYNHEVEVAKLERVLLAVAVLVGMCLYIVSYTGGQDRAVYKRTEAENGRR